MHRKTPRFDPAFLESKRRQLLKLRGQLQKTAKPARPKGRHQRSIASQAREYEDDAQKLAMLETEEIWSTKMSADWRASSERCRRSMKVPMDTPM